MSWGEPGAPEPGARTEVGGQGRVLAIVNPAAGKGATEDELEAIRRFVEDRESAGELRQTGAGGDARRWAERAGRDGFDAILAAGGDGTIREAVEGVARSGAATPVYPLALGTGNVIAGLLGVPGDLEEALPAMDRATGTRLDVGRVVGSGEHFLIAAGAGYPALVMRDATSEAKSRFGYLAYVVSAIRNLLGRRTRTIKIVADGVDRRFRAKSVLVLNVPRVPGVGALLERPVDPRDGLLDVVLAEVPTLIGIVRSLLTRLLRLRQSSPAVHHLRARHVLVTAWPPLPTQIDGDTLGTTPLEVEVVEGGCVLLGAEELEEGSRGRAADLRRE